VPLLVLDDLGMRKLPLTAAEELLEIIMRRYERASTRADLEPPGGTLGKSAGKQLFDSLTFWPNPLLDGCITTEQLRAVRPSDSDIVKK
jgi:hypothetical protein